MNTMNKDTDLSYKQDAVPKCFYNGVIQWLFFQEQLFSFLISVIEVEWVDGGSIQK